MDPQVVILRPGSWSDRAALTALLDLGELLAEAPIAIEDTRVIGGHMVAIHVARRGSTTLTPAVPRTPASVSTSALCSGSA